MSIKQLDETQLLVNYSFLLLLLSIEKKTRLFEQNKEPTFIT